MHAWEACLIYYPLSQGYQAPATQLDLRDVQIMQNPPITSRVFAFHWNRYNVTQAVIYWRESLIFASNSSVEQKNVQISLTMFPSSSESVQQTELQLQKVAETVCAYWEPIKTWTPVALLLSQYADILAATALCGLLSISLMYLIGAVKNPGKVAYAKLSKQDQSIVTALRQTQRSTIATPNNIAASYETLTHQRIDEAELSTRLKGLAHVGLVGCEIRSVDDHPVLVWKTIFNGKLQAIEHKYNYRKLGKVFRKAYN
jgi:hypothetical protein